jgi:uncharacterized damage-inducible protein DinB
MPAMPLAITGTLVTDTAVSIPPPVVKKPPPPVEEAPPDNSEQLRVKAEREKLDEVIIRWIKGVSESDIDDYLLYKNMAGIPQRKSIESLISHLFLHQIHHRGQATTLISQSGVDFGETDILEIIDDHSA